MVETTLTKTRFGEGVWEGVLTGGPGGGWQPKVAVMHMERAVPGVEVIEDREAGHWVVRVPVPVSILGDGVQTLLIRDLERNETLHVISLISGEALADDIRAEVDLLREELDMLKRAFRRHCLETL